MADYADGSVIIDTELDTKNFEGGIEGVKKRLDELIKGVERQGEKISTSLNQTIPLLSRISDGILALYQSMSASAGQASASTNELTQAENEAAAGATRLGAAVSSSSQRMTATEKIAASLAADLEKLSASARNGFENGSAVLRFYDQIQAADAKVAELAQRVREFGNSTVPTAEYQEVNDQYVQLEANLNKLLEKQELMTEHGVSETSAQWKNLQIDIDTARKAVADCKAEMDSMKAAGQAFVLGKETDEYERLSEQLENARTVLAEQKTLIDAASISEARAAVEAAQRELIEARIAGDIERDAKAMAALADAQKAVKDAAAMQSSNPTPLNHSEEEREAARAAAAAHREEIAAHKEAEQAAKARDARWNRFKGTIKSVHAALKSIRTAFSSLSKKIKSAGKDSTLTSNGLVKSLTSIKTMLLSRIKRTFISKIFNEAKEGLNDLARFSSEFDSTMSNLKNRAKELSSNLSVTIGNFVSMIEPILTPIIEAFSRAVEYVNSFFAMLQGKSTVTVAKKQTESYADSLDDAAESAKKLKAQVYGFDELNKASSDTSKDKKDGTDRFETKDITDVVPSELLDYLQKIKDALLGGEWENAGRLIAEGLNSIVSAIDDWINAFRPKAVEWAGNIAELFNGLVYGFDWSNAGKTIADGLNLILDVLNTFLTKFDFKALGKGFGDAINGFFDWVEWDLLGETFANKWNALIDFIFGLVSTVKWDTIGDSFAEAVQSFADTLKIEELADTIGIGLNGIVTLLQHFLDGVDWDGIAARLGDGVNRIFGHIDWSNVGKLLSDGVKTALSFISTAIETVDWFSIGADVSKALNAIDWPGIFGELGRTLSDLLVGALDLLLGLAKTLDWFKLGQDLWDSLIAVLNSIDWNGIISKAFGLLGAAVGGAVGLLGGLISKIWDSLVSAWNSTKSYFDDEIEAAGGDIWKGIGNGLLKAIVNIGAWILDKILIPFAEGFSEALGFESMEDCGIAIYEGIIKPIGDFFAKIGTWIKEHIFDPFVNGFKKLFGINSPSTVMQELGGFLIDGLLKGITDTWHSITDFFTKTLPELGDKIKNKWDDIRKSTEEKFGAIRETLTSKFSEAKEKTVEHAANLKTKLGEIFNTVKTNAVQKFSEMKNNVTSTFSTAKATLTSTASTLKSDLLQKWNNVYSDASTKWANVKKTITDAAESFRSTATQKVESLKQDVRTKWENLKTDLDRTHFDSTGENLVSGLQSGIESAWSGLTRTVKRLATDLTGLVQQTFEINSPSRVWARIGEYLDAGLQEGISDNSRDVLRAVSAMAQSVNDSMSLDKPDFDVNANTLSMLDRLNQKFDGMIDRLLTMHDALDGIDGFTVPAFATGTVIPYSTRALTYQPSGGVYGDSDAWQTLSNQEEIMSEMMYLLGQILDVVRKINPNIDAGNLAQLVTYYQRKTILDNGGV